MRQYHDLLKAILRDGDGHDDRTGVGTISLFGYQMRFDLAEGFPILTTKRIPFSVLVQELVWFLSGSGHVDDLRRLPDDAGKPVRIWDEWATDEKCAEFGREAGDLGFVYGPAWRSWPLENGKKFDQLAEICAALSDAKDRKSRRLIVTGWHPKKAAEVSLPPCHTLWQLKWHEHTNKLDLQLYQRSADVFLGVPFNISSYALLLSLLAHAHDMLPGSFIHTFGDVHIYRNHLEQVDTLLSRHPYALPTLRLSSNLKGMGLQGVLNFRRSDVELLNYVSHGRIAADVAV